MNAKNLFTTVAILCLLFGLALIFAPNFMGDQYLTNPTWINEGAKLLSQGWGVLLTAMAVSCWYIRNDGPSLGRKAMLLLVLVSNLGFMLIHAMAVINGIETALGWMQVLMAFIIGSWAGMLFRQEERVLA